jgi:8-oxo-dGTP diphosphatase
MDDTKILMSIRAIIRKGNDFLLVQRASDDSFEPSKFEFPGGKVDPGEDLNDSLYREIYEETGLMVTIHEPLFYWDAPSIKEKYADFRHVSLFFECSVPINAKVKTSFEHDQYTWQTLDIISRRNDLASTTEEAVKRLEKSK